MFLGHQGHEDLGEVDPGDEEGERYHEHEQDLLVPAELADVGQKIVKVHVLLPGDHPGFVVEPARVEGRRTLGLGLEFLLRRHAVDDHTYHKTARGAADNKTGKRAGRVASYIVSR